MGFLSATTIAALISAIFGGFLVKWIDGRTRLKVKNLDLATVIRDELYKESGELRDRIDKAEAECNEWRDRYFDLLKDLNPLRGALRACEDRVQRMEASELRRQEKERT